MIRMKAVIRHKNHRRILARLVQQRPQHLILKLIRHRYYVVIQLEIALPDPGLPGRVIAHERMTEMIDGIEVNREKIPRLVFSKPKRGGLHALTLRQCPQECRQALVLILIDLSRQRNKRFHHFRRELIGMYA